MMQKKTGNAGFFSRYYYMKLNRVCYETVQTSKSKMKG